MARQPNSYWNRDWKNVTRNPNLTPKPKLESSGVEVDFDAYQAEQREKALAMRSMTRGKR